MLLKFKAKLFQVRDCKRGSVSAGRSVGAVGNPPVLQDEEQQLEDEIVAQEVVEEEQEPLAEAGPLGDAQDLWGDFGLQLDNAGGEDLGSPGAGNSPQVGQNAGDPAASSDDHRAPCADRAAVGHNAREVVVDGERLLFTDLFDNAQGARRWNGMSLACSSCGVSRNLHFVRTGMSVMEAAERLVAWRDCCPGRHESRAHRDLGDTKHAGRLMRNYNTSGKLNVVVSPSVLLCL